MKPVSNYDLRRHSLPEQTVGPADSASGPSARPRSAQ